MKLEFSRHFKNTKISNLIKVLLLEAELFQADGRKNGQAVRRADGQTDIHAYIHTYIHTHTHTHTHTHNEANSRFSEFYQRTKTFADHYTDF